MIILLRRYRDVLFFLVCFAFFAWLTVQNNAHLDHWTERAFNAGGVALLIGYLLYVLRK